MSFGTNLQNLRKQNNVTQEELADALGVSRQTVSKWEQDGCYPETDKIVTICRMYSVSMDQLMLGELAQAPQTERSAREIRETQKRYDRHMNAFSVAMAFGVCLILLGVAMLVFLQSLKADLSSESATTGYDIAGVIILLAAVAVSSAIFIWFGILHDQFVKETDLRDIEYEKSVLNAFNRRFAACIASGVVLVLAGVILLIPFADQPEQVVVRMTAVMLALIAVASFLFVFAGIQHSRYYMEERPSGNQTDAEKLSSAICGSIMLVATAVFLLLGLVWGLWHPGWVVFPVGGILCGVVSNIVSTRNRQK